MQYEYQPQSSPPLYYHPPTPQPSSSTGLPSPSTSSFLWPSPAASTQSPAQQQHNAYTRPHLKRTHAWSASSNQDQARNQLGLTSINEDDDDELHTPSSYIKTLSTQTSDLQSLQAHTNTVDNDNNDDDDGDGDRTRRKRLRVQAPSDEFALLSLAPGSPLSPPPSSSEAASSASKRPLILSSPPPPLSHPTASLQLSSPPATVQPLTAAHLSSLGLDLATPALPYTHAGDGTSSTSFLPPPAPPPSAHSQDEPAIDEEVEMKPGRSSWEIAPNRIYIASLDDSDDDEERDVDHSTLATSRTVTPTVPEHNDDRGTDMMDDDDADASAAGSGKVRINPVALSHTHNKSILPIPPPLLDQKEKQLSHNNSLVLYKPLSSFVAAASDKPLHTLTRDERSQRDDDLQEFRRMQQRVEKMQDDENGTSSGSVGSGLDNGGNTMDLDE
ncbi:hypothetical protein ACM66B_004687 [Microbotryomycetes sp. NB124-2]